MTATAPAASIPATTGGTSPDTSSATIRIRIAIARRAPRPSGMARRIDRGSVTATTSGPAAKRSSAAQAPWTSTASPGRSTQPPRASASRVSMSTVPDPSCPPDERTDRITRRPSNIVVPGWTCRPVYFDRGGSITSTTPSSAVNSESVGIVTS